MTTDADDLIGFVTASRTEQQACDGYKPHRETLELALEFVGNLQEAVKGFGLISDAAHRWIDTRDAIETDYDRAGFGMARIADTVLGGLVPLIERLQRVCHEERERGEVN